MHPLGVTKLNKIIEWLLEGEPWVEYRTRVDLLEQAEILSKHGFSQFEISSHMAFQVIEDDLRKTRQSKRKDRAERIFTNLIEGLE